MLESQSVSKRAPPASAFRLEAGEDDSPLIQSRMPLGAPFRNATFRHPATAEHEIISAPGRRRACVEQGRRKQNRGPRHRSVGNGGTKIPRELRAGRRRCKGCLCCSFSSYFRPPLGLSAPSFPLILTFGDS